MTNAKRTLLQFKGGLWCFDIVDIVSTTLYIAVISKSYSFYGVLQVIENIINRDNTFSVTHIDES